MLCALRSFAVSPSGVDSNTALRNGRALKNTAEKRRSWRGLRPQPKPSVPWTKPEAPAKGSGLRLPTLLCIATRSASFEVALLQVDHTSPKRQRGTQGQAPHEVASNARAPRWRFGLVLQ